ncbi:MAG: Hsp20/alpha crystallin family protein [Dysgonamonadaceae bacterium]|jgi:HSP20 family protein|nr:Hsp20/alpha crystallin family protein [Dysgonamonadaceae bacterium]
MMSVRKSQAWLPEVLFGNLLSDNTFTHRAATSPALNIVENENGFRVELAVPGVAKEAIKVDVNKNNELVISGETQTGQEEKQERYLRKEFACTQFVKTIALPDETDKDAISATYTDGVLSVEIPLKAKDATEETKSISIA